MDWTKVEHKLARSFRATPQRLGESMVVPRRRPLELAPLLEAALGPDEEDLLYELGVHGLLEEEDAWTSVLFFYWDGFGPISWTAGLGLVGTGTRRYLSVWDEVSGHRALAAIEPWDDPLAVSAAVSGCLAVNGSKHGDWLLGSLPHELTNRAPDLLPTPVVRQALFDYMQRKELVEGAAWSSLASEHYGRIVEPNHLERCLDLLRGLPRLDDPEAIDAWIEAREAESAAMPDHERQRIFDEWFATAYEVEAREMRP
jgi:hypothetical protein